MQNVNKKAKQQLDVASSRDLILAWELNTQKIITLLDYTLSLRLKMRNRVNECEFSDFVFIDALESSLKQFKTIAEE